MSVLMNTLTKKVKNKIKREERIDYQERAKIKRNSQWVNFNLGIINMATGFLYKLIPMPLAIFKMMLDFIKLGFTLLMSVAGFLKYVIEQFMGFAKWFYV